MKRPMGEQKPGSPEWVTVAIRDRTDSDNAHAAKSSPREHEKRDQEGRSGDAERGRESP